MTITIATAQTASLLTDFDQLDIADAIRNAAAYDATSLTARDRQALALLTYAPGLDGVTGALVTVLADDRVTLPLQQDLAGHLLDVIGNDDLLGPEPEWDVQEAWLAARESAELRARLDRLMAATRDLTDSAHRPLTYTLNTLGDIADHTPGLDITDWSQLHLHAMTALENMETERLAGRPFEAWARELKGRLNALAGVIYRALDDDQPEESEDEPLPFDNGECSTCPCCSAEDCENGECLDDRAGSPKCPCTVVYSDTVLRTVPAQNGMQGYQVHALRSGAPLPGGRHIARVDDYGCDTHLSVIASDGSESYLHRHTEIHVLDSGVVRLVQPAYAGWAAD